MEHVYYKLSMELMAFCLLPTLTDCCPEWRQTHILILILEINTVATINTDPYAFFCRITSLCIFIWTFSVYQDIIRRF